MKPPRFLSLLLAALLAPMLPGLTGCATAPAPQTAEPPNLWLLKQELIAYADSGAYGRDLAAAAAVAQAWVEQRAARGDGEKLAIVFDLDETLLSNLAHMREMDFGYLPGLWDQWVAEGSAPAIGPVKEVYLAARARGVAVFYLTGRREKDRPGTEAHLRAAGLDDHVSLHCKPDDDRGPTQAFKTTTRKKITEAGYTIIANLGDQQSDLAGGYAERTFKLPNPFYITK